MRRLSVALVLLFFTNLAWSWNFRGHALIAERAFAYLSAHDRQCVNSYAQLFYRHLSRRFQAKLSRYYPHTATLSKLASLPDTWRGKTVTQLFQRFHATLALALLPYRDQSTRSWHFYDHSYPYSCAIANDSNAAKLLLILQKAWWQTSDPNSRALLLIWITHLLADLHQPLHTLSYADSQCHIDYGGNHYFVLTDNGKQSLHKLWDAGLGYLNGDLSYQDSFPVTQKRLAKNLNPYDWVQENLRYAAFIYRVPEYHHLDDSYYQQGQVIVRDRIALGAYRLAKILKALCA